MNLHTRRRATAASLALVTTAALVAALPSAPASAADPDLAQLGTATASASQDDRDGTFPAANAIDGNPTTRWASGNGPDDGAAVFLADLTSDLGRAATVSSVDLAWEASYAVAYDVQLATEDPEDPASWTTAYSTTTGDGGADVITLDTPTTARYVRIAMKKRAAATWEAPTLHYYGYSLYTLAVRGTFARPLVGLGAPTTVAAGEPATVPVRLSNPSETEQTVRVRTGGGTGVAGTDYTAVDEVVTFAPGDTEEAVEVETFSRGALAPRRTVDLALSEPSAGIDPGARTSTTVTITPTGALPETGSANVVHDFEDGVPAGFTTWGITDAVKPVLTTAPDGDVPGSPAGNDALVATVGGTPAAGDWFGFTNDTPATDWSAYDGFSFWFLGTGSGKRLSYELKSDGRMFDQDVTDDSTGWRRVKVLFTDLRLKGNHASDARFTPNASTGFAVTLTGLGQGAWRFDDFALYERAVLVDDYETPVQISTDAPVGYFIWKGSEDTTVTIGQEPQERGAVVDNDVLSGTYEIPTGSYGGFSKNLVDSQDWSSFRGIRFWWYASQASNPASPTAGADIPVEVKDGGPDGEHSELWRATFKDNWGSSTSRWKLVELPFSSFTPSAYQPGNAETKNGTLDLTSAWGFAVTFAVGTPTPVRWALDDVELYGTPATAGTVSVAPTQDVTLVDAGQTATVDVALTTTTGEPTTEAVEVDWATGGGTAVAGTDYTADSGTLTFPVGTESGATQPLQVETQARAGGSEALDVPIELTASGVTLPETRTRVVLNAHDLPYLDAALPTPQRVADLLGRMSIQEKAGQMAQAERLGLTSPDQIAALGLGSVLSGGGSTPKANTPEAWAAMIDGFQRQALSTPLQVPLVYGADAVHGHSNVKDATIFPHNIGLGATRDPALVERIARATASETRTTGVNWAFSPCLCVSRDERWGRTYESLGEDPALVRAFSRSAVVGLQGDDPTDITAADEVLASAKHWAGDGGTSYDPTKVGNGYPIDQGVTNVTSLEQFRELYVTPYEPAIEAGAGTIMPSYSGVSVDGGPVVRMHENTVLNTDLLKDELGYDGFLISDWEGIDKLPGGTYADKVERSVNSGLDMAMAPYNFGAFINAVVAGVDAGDITGARVDDAVSRILTEKFDLGLFEQPFTDASQREAFGGEAHRAIARKAAAESQVLLRNTGALPLARTGKLYVAGSNADDLGNQMGGWSISWQGGSGKGMTTGTTILEGLQQSAPDLDVTYSKTAAEPTTGYDAGLVVVGETPYAEGQGDVGNNGKSLSLSNADRAAIETVCGAMECTVVVVSGRPQVLTGAAASADAVVASFLPGSEGAGVADVLLGDEPFTGQLPMTWPASADQVPVNVGDASYDPAYAYGWGLRTDGPRARLTTLRASLTGTAASAAQALLDAPVWTAGAIGDADRAWPLLTDLAAELGGRDDAVLPQAAVVGSLARDVAQAAVVAGTAGAQAQRGIADAEHLLWSGKAADAVDLLGEVAGVEPVAEPDAITSTSAPTVRGSAVAGGRLVATAGTWSVAGTTASYRWLRDGSVVPGATSASYLLGAADVGHRLRVRVTATKAGYLAGTATSAATAVVRKAVPSVAVSVTPKRVRPGTRPKVRVRVSSSAIDRATGRITLRYAGKVLRVTLDRADRGVVTVRLPARRKGSYRLAVTYDPTGSAARVLTGATARKVSVRVR
ncbi:glycoside hydrolase family 3 N-terminal domain-containing protein [Nocardioides lianchengensis]|uniref:beta-glucosidase n=1 Tax=Nocardioides lianchengensis TaxID=1045774 RepID=A0A1G7ABY4_9ACTN|nr:glycoside hydrolase family 3 N-terminal domain-containing protein [Nocardioides lianchengensis]NYG13662.1 beta-glucosidase [Nocardioides lianchengensis]SDE11565.1 beta-glucosidase [Nocardioides lianchengensis]